MLIMEVGFSLLVIAIVSLCTNARGPLCFNCLAVRSPGECQSVTECRSSETCFTEFFLFNNEIPAFSFGCRNTQECQSEANIGVKLCQKCCTGDLCNNNICTNGTAPPTGTPCLDCTAVSSTNSCYHLTYCKEEEVCYSEVSEHTQHGLTYKLGCLEKKVCSNLGAAIIGKRRSAANPVPHHTCCETAGCNYEGISQITTMTTPAIRKAKDCWDLKTIYNIVEDGVYEVLTPDGHRRSLRCDMTTDGGGWTVFQRRGDGSVSFNQNYEIYRSLFGSLTGEFWMGNDFLYELTSDVHQTMRVDICDWNNTTEWAKYGQFSVGPPADKYRLHVSIYNGTAGDALVHYTSPEDNHNGSPFSTLDVDNDIWGGGNCAAEFSSGWWFNHCFEANLNGVYLSESHSTGTQQGIQWQTWIYVHSFKGSEMKTRPSTAVPLTRKPFTCPVI